MYIQRPTEKGTYTKEDLREYARQRKNTEIVDIQNLFNDKNILDGTISLEDHEEYREPLSIAKEVVITIFLSTGGDGDGFKLTFNEHNELIKGLYYWADWGAYEEVRLTNQEAELVDGLYCISDWLNNQ